MKPLPLHALHVAKNAELFELRGFEQVRSFGDVAGELNALQAASALQDRGGRGLIRLSGPDAITFLHGQTTNDVNKLAPGHGHGAAILTAKGKMLGEVRVFRRADDVWVETEVGFGEAVKTALERNCISEEVEFAELTESYAQLGLYGPEAHAVLTAVRDEPAPGLAEHEHAEIVIAGAQVIAIGTRGPGSGGFDLVVPIVAIELVWNAIVSAGAAKKIRAMGESAYELARIEAGIPRFGVDMTEDTNPLEANLERDISYNKGCYVGQEVIAKATFRGHVNKKLARLKFDALPEIGAELKLDDRVVGRVTSAAAMPDGRKLGIGYVKRDLAKEGVKLTFASGAAETLGLAQPK